MSSSLEVLDQWSVAMWAAMFVVRGQTSSLPRLLLHSPHHQHHQRVEWPVCTAGVARWGRWCTRWAQCLPRTSSITRWPRPRSSPGDCRDSETQPRCTSTRELPRRSSTSAWIFRLCWQSSTVLRKNMKFSPDIVQDHRKFQHLLIRPVIVQLI